MPTKKEEPADIIVTKVRSNRKSISIEWTQGIDQHALTCHDNPLPSFNKALAALNPHVLALCEMPTTDLEKVKATGLTITIKGDNNHALIVAQKRIRDGKRVFNITTPSLPMHEDEENKAMDHLSEDEEKAIEKVIKEAKKYVAGDRAQGQSEFEGETKAEEKPADGTVPFPQLTQPAEGSGS